MTNSEEDLRHACEVRDLFDRSRFPTRAHITGYIAGVEKKRGAPAAEKLLRDYRAEFEKRKEDS